ncbi:MAG: hypothetical protein PHC41_15380 [Lachnospiraceae bacterium]|jgi:hypothetical protein|nr:hypothetical protein [Lachnospiraceae bacterium]MDD3617579.1 hypothetical protein [Lachnospiraceae bacterium]
MTKKTICMFLLTLILLGAFLIAYEWVRERQEPVGTLVWNRCGDIKHG